MRIPWTRTLVFSLVRAAFLVFAAAVLPAATFVAAMLHAATTLAAPVQLPIRAAASHTSVPHGAGNSGARAGDGGGGAFDIGGETIQYGFVEYREGQPYALQGETWTFDHGSGDPLEGWTAQDLSSDPAAYFRVITGASWAGHGNPEHIPIIHPGGTAWLGLFEDEATAACYSHGIGYGNLWAQQFTSPQFALTGSGDLTIGFDCYCQLEPDFDEVQVKVVFPNGSSVDAGGPISGVHGWAEEDEWERIALTVPSASLSGQTQAQVRFEMRSDVGYSDEDGVYPTTLAPFAFANVSAERAGARLLQGFGNKLPLTPSQVVSGSQMLEELGKAVCVFDVNEDGYDDVLIGDPQYSNGQSQEGRVLAYFGSAGGIFESAPSWSHESNSANARFGSAIAAGYSSLNDTAPMLLIGARGYSNGQASEGRLYLFATNGGSIDPSPVWTYESNVAAANLGWSVDCGDFTGDGVDDVVAGAPYLANGQTAEGRIYGWNLYDIFTAPTWTKESNQVNCFLGTLVKVIEDPMFGGYVLTGVPYFDGASGVDCGTVQMRDATGNVVGVPPLGAHAGSQLGLAIAGIGNIDVGGLDFAITEGNHTASPALNIFTVGGIGELDPYVVLEDASFGTEIVSAYHYDSYTSGTIMMYSWTTNTVRLLELRPWENTWNELWSMSVGSATTAQAMAATGDINNDGARDLVVGLPGYDSGQGRVQVHLRSDTNDAGWVASPVPAIGAQFGAVGVGGYTLPEGGCGLSGNVFEMHDATGHHPEGQHVRLLSPIIDMNELDDEYTRFVAKANTYWDTPYGTGVYMKGGWSYYPWDCPVTGAIGWSPPEMDGTPYEYGFDGCTPASWDSNDAGPIRVFLPGAQKLRFFLELWASCDAFGVPPGSCNVPDNVSPLLDNIRIEAVNGGAIAGTVRRTPNATNCVQNLGPTPYVSATLYDDGTQQVAGETLTDINGAFRFHDLTPGRIYRLAIDPGNYWADNCHDEYYFYNGTAIQNIEVGLYPSSGNVTDLAVMMNAGQAKPGFSTTYGVVCQNPGTMTAIANVTLHLPPEVAFSSATASGAYDSNAHTVTWSGIGTQPFRTWTFSVTGVVSTGVSIGAELLSSVDYGPPSGDVAPENNHAECVQTVVGAIDPNDKEVTPAGVIAQQTLLQYKINFQNVGTASATNVRIEDTLEEDLDLSTLSFGATSHAATNVSVQGRKLIWQFDGIELPDSTSNEPGSHGFVSFSARPIAGLPPYREVTNQAQIYFDFASPVATNVVTNTIEGPSGVESPSTPREFGLTLLGALPARDEVGFEMSIPATGPLAVRIHDVGGRVVRTVVNAPSEAGTAHLLWDGRDDAGRRVSGGIYFVRAQWSGAGRRADRTARVVVLE